MTRAKLSPEDSILERLAPHVEDMPAELRPLIQQEDPVVGQRHLPRPRHLPAADLTRVGDDVGWGSGEGMVAEVSTVSSRASS